LGEVDLPPAATAVFVIEPANEGLGKPCKTIELALLATTICHGRLGNTVVSDHSTTPIRRATEIIKSRSQVGFPPLRRGFSPAGRATVGHQTRPSRTFSAVRRQRALAPGRQAAYGGPSLA
jgi:hypothetical protein